MRSFASRAIDFTDRSRFESEQVQGFDDLWLFPPRESRFVTWYTFIYPWSKTLLLWVIFYCPTRAVQISREMWFQRHNVTMLRYYLLEKKILLNERASNTFEIGSIYIDIEKKIGKKKENRWRESLCGEFQVVEACGYCKNSRVNNLWFLKLIKLWASSNLSNIRTE